jgi:hypothetical protein
MATTIDIPKQRSYELLMDFASTKTASAELCMMVRQLINNILSSSKYHWIGREDKEDLATLAMIEFLQYSHNFNPKSTYSHGVAIGYLNGNCSRAIWRGITKMKKHSDGTAELGDIEVAYWDTEFDHIFEEKEEQ